MDELLTPEEIIQQRFPEAERGYDQARVDAFLHTLALEIEALMKSLERERERVADPFMTGGREIADLIRSAHDKAQALEEEGRKKSTISMQRAEKRAAELESEAEEIMRQAKRDAQDLLTQARAEADALLTQASERRRTADAEASVIVREGQNEAHRLRKEAGASAESILAAARQEAAAITGHTQRRLRALQLEEVRCEERLVKLRARVETAEAEAPPEPEADDEFTENEFTEDGSLEAAADEAAMGAGETEPEPIRIIADDVPGGLDDETGNLA